MAVWLVFGAFAELSADPLVRVENTTLQLPAEMPVLGYDLVSAFGLTFDEPVAITSPPGEADRVFVVERGGRIMVVDLAANPPVSSVFLDIRGKVISNYIECGLLGLAFHPDYANNGQFFVFRTSYESSAAAQDFLHDVISRYTVSATDPDVADPSSEQFVIKQLDVSEEHNGGDLHFGPDGYLYFTIGDKTPGPVDASDNLQAIDGGLFAGLFRIDVDKKPGSLAPNPHHSVTENYAIPPDNPFVGMTDYQGVALDPAEVRTEYYANGFRNPFRFSFHPTTGELYLGDVGNALWEEIDKIVKGGNYGWPYYEAMMRTTKKRIRRTGPHEPPVITIKHGRAPFQGNSIVGGVFYQGSKLGGLDGAYIYGDHRSGNMWAFFPDGSKNNTPENWLANKFGISCFGRDPSNGDILVGNVATGDIDRLVYVAPEDEAPFPKTLAETGIFSDLATLEPNAGVVPYELNSRFWSDYAKKSRWFSLPDLADKIDFVADGIWDFPTGSVWVKHFEMEMVRGDETSKRRLETRVLVKQEEGAYGVTYRWDPTTGVASLVPSMGMDEELMIEEEDGVARPQLWRYPGRGECATCHTPAGGYALGFSSSQLNLEVMHGGDLHNQINLLAGAGYYSNPPDAQAVTKLRRETPPADERVSLHDRARSYLSVNCSYCHQPNTITEYWDGRLSTNFSQMGLNSAVLNPNNPTASLLHYRLATPGVVRMPPIGSSEIDPAGDDLIYRWIQSMPRAPWEQTTFGNPQREGNASIEVAEDVITVAGAWGGQGGTDLGQFLKRPSSGNTQVMVRLDSQHTATGSGRAGLMVRDAAGGLAAFARVQDDGSVSLVEPGGEIAAPGEPITLPTGPHWLRLKREGNSVSADARSDDGDWLPLGTLVADFADTLDYGMQAASDVSTDSNRAKFSQFTLTSIQMLEPELDLGFVAGDSIGLEAAVSKVGDVVLERVEFYRGDLLIGEALSSPYQITWEAPAGDHLMTAVLLDQDGGRLESEAVSFSVDHPIAGGTYVGSFDHAGGNWDGLIGSDGFSIAGGGMQLPAWVEFDDPDVSLSSWVVPTGDARAMYDPDTAAPGDGIWESGGALVFDFDLGDGHWHDVTFYFLDWDRTSREQVITVRDLMGGVLAQQTISDFGDGKYETFRLRGVIEVTVEPVVGDAIVSGVLFDAVVNASPPVVLIFWTGLLSLIAVVVVWRFRFRFTRRPGSA
ncbi:MAG: glucose/arabinose dehydrogenase/mono/diheme cytochrome c family protein [Verrucomicrobiales bacterium]|jgi:glucose/arabinose dehydrogenase/mono/diheme cytochrome c family protein/regulation of enolase protein 1 (concanavalin A-like superfamily)